MNNPLLIFGLGTGEIIVIVVVILLVCFYNHIYPNRHNRQAHRTARECVGKLGHCRGLGKGVRSFKEGMNGVESEINKPVEKPKQSDGDTQK